MADSPSILISDLSCIFMLTFPLLWIFNQLMIAAANKAQGPDSLAIEKTSISQPLVIAPLANWNRRLNWMPCSVNAWVNEVAVLLKTRTGSDDMTVSISIYDRTWSRLLLCAKFLLIALKLLVFGEVHIEMTKELTPTEVKEAS